MMERRWRDGEIEMLTVSVLRIGLGCDVLVLRVVLARLKHHVRFSAEAQIDHEEPAAWTRGPWLMIAA